MNEYICLVTVTVYICEYSSHSYMSVMVNKYCHISVTVNKLNNSVNIDLNYQLMHLAYIHSENRGAFAPNLLNCCIKYEHFKNPSRLAS